MTKFEQINDSIELSDGRLVDLYERHWFDGDEKKIEYKTIDEDGKSDYYVATKDPENLTKEERHEVLDYCLATFDDDEGVNYSDLFIHGKFITKKP